MEKGAQNLVPSLLRDDTSCESSFRRSLGLLRGRFDAGTAAAEVKWTNG
jgi:hypothetical protein